ncbi:MULTISPECIES: hypothetical protein [unclassified Streptomyces]|uniref:hypothetical protein n=1 Tax=unclassified Streptomyces TaxID=2593676 RepID=UPI002E2A9FA1|nr:hypothetical protein [Streptomyces sp. NBC_00223]
MTHFGTVRQRLANPRVAAMAADPADEEGSRRRAEVLGEVAAEGTVGLFRVLRRATARDREVADIRASALVHALPWISALDGHDVLLRAHVHDKQTVGDLSSGERVELCELVARAEHEHNRQGA